VPLFIFPCGNDNNADAYESANNTGFQRATSQISVQAHTSSSTLRTIGGFRFPISGIPQGTQIVSAFFKPYLVDGTNNDPECWIRGHDVDSTPDFATNQDVTIRNLSFKTSATVTWQDTNVGDTGQQIKSPNIKAVIQEIVDRAAWSEDSITLLLEGTQVNDNRLHVAAYDHATIAPADLEIRTPGGGNPNEPPEQPNVGGSGAIKRNRYRVFRR
jgi:hypothetical protein